MRQGRVYRKLVFVRGERTRIRKILKTEDGFYKTDKTETLFDNEFELTEMLERQQKSLGFRLKENLLA